FNWTVFVSDAEAHRFAHVNLIREQVRSYSPGEGFIAMLDSVYQPLSAARWETRTRYGEGAAKALAREAWNSPATPGYRWFAELLGRAARRVHALIDQVAPDLGDVEHGANLAVEQADHSTRRPGRGEHAPPAHHRRRLSPSPPADCR